MTSFILYVCAAVVMLFALLAATMAGMSADDANRHLETTGGLAIASVVLSAIAYALLVIA